MKRIFYYSGYRLTIFHWENEECIAKYIFNPGEEGLEKFNTYLRATSNTPVRLLVDLIEEDFKKDTIPHVGFADRKAIVSRLINRQYRKSKDYAHFRIIGRETSGRKDDILLYSVLSNPDILEPWLKPMLAAGISISGIWSLPLLSEKLFKLLDKKSKNILLVSQQVPSNLRQTFLINGRFESSRSAVVNLEDATIGDYITTEVEQTIRFLSNQRHIGFDEKIEIHVICRSSDLTDIQSKCKDGTIRSFHYHDIDEVQEKIGCKKHSSEYSNSLYSYICAKQPVPVGHYGNKSLFSKYYEQLFSTALYTASAFILLLATILSFSYISQSIVLDEETVLLQTQADSINNDYQKHLAKIEHKLNRSKIMQSSVLLANKIQNTKLVSPQNFMVDASRILTRSGMHDTEITKLMWSQYQNSELPESIDYSNKSPIDYANPSQINQIATLTGYLRVSQISLKQSVNKTNAIADAFDSNNRISKVNIKRMPVDTRSKSTIDKETSSDTKSASKDDFIQGLFEIDLLMKGRES